ncbi:MAG: hypothetical protein NT169_27180 [Chloroflexi bacterium]|nr:hypothetical protein [Chloroflexota bacterium]
MSRSGPVQGLRRPAPPQRTQPFTGGRVGGRYDASVALSVVGAQLLGASCVRLAPIVQVADALIGAEVGHAPTLLELFQGTMQQRIGVMLARPAEHGAGGRSQGRIAPLGGRAAAC